MESQEKKLSHLESLEIISATINRTKDNYRDNSFYFLLWGWLVAFASVTFFILQHYSITTYYYLPFPILGSVGILASIFRYVRHKSMVTESYLTYYLSRLWMVLGLNFILVVFINVSQGNLPFVYTLIIAGIGTLASGLVMKFTPMMVGGVLFMIAAIVSVYIADDYKVLIHGIAILAGYLIPGHLLKNSKK